MPPLKYWKIKEYLEEVAVRPESATRMPTVRELMKQFNVSLATVNRALSELENDGVIVRRQGSGIVAARSSRTSGRMEERNREERTLLFIHNDYPDESLWNLTHIVEQYSRQFKCNVADCKVHQDTKTEELIAFVHAQKNCAGVVLLIGTDLLDRDRLEALGRLPMRVVVMDSMYFYADYLPENIYIVSPDGASCARQIAALLLQKGHRKIGYIRNEPRSEYTDLHQKAFQQELRKAGVEFGPERIFSSTIRSWENALDAAVQVTRANIDRIREMGLTALVYKSSGGALVSVKTLQEAGFRIPEDISVTGEGERKLYRYLSPGLTVVGADFEQMGRTAVEIALGEQTPREHNIFIPQILIERDSVKNLNNQPSEDVK